MYLPLFETSNWMLTDCLINDVIIKVYNMKKLLGGNSNNDDDDDDFELDRRGNAMCTYSRCVNML